MTYREYLVILDELHLRKTKLLNSYLVRWPEVYEINTRIIELHSEPLSGGPKLLLVNVG